MNNRTPALRARMIQAAYETIAGDMEAIAGLTKHGLLLKLEAATEATRTLVATKDGQISDRLDVPDYPTRLRAVVEALHLHNAYPAKQFEIGGTLRVEQLHEIAIQLAALPPDRLAELAGIVDAEEAVALSPAPEEIVA